MNACLLFLCLTLGGRNGPQPQPRDGWFGEDKLKHFVTTFLVTSLAASGARAAGLDQGTSLVVGAGTGAVVGVGKELSDRRRDGTASFKDIVWDLAGVGAASVVQARAQ